MAWAIVIPRLGWTMEEGVLVAWLKRDGDEVQAGARALHKLVAALARNAPPKGEKASWDQLTKAYADNAKKLEDAALKKDLKAARAAAAAMGDASCTACHKAHRK